MLLKRFLKRFLKTAGSWQVLIRDVWLHLVTTLEKSPMHKIGKNRPKMEFFDFFEKLFLTLFALKLSLMSSSTWKYENSQKKFENLSILTIFVKKQTQLKIFTHFGAPCMLAQLTQRTRARAAHLTKQAMTFATAAGQSYRETIRDGAGNTFTPKTILKFNLLLILYLKVWNKIVHKSWKSKKLETHNHNVLRFKALIINKTFSMFGSCKFCILEYLTKNIILIAGHSWPAPLPYGLVFLWGHFMTLAPLRGILTDLRKMRSASTYPSE
jgi:hypothetical protein